MATIEWPWVLAPPILIHALAVPAIVVASFQSLNFWRAVSVLSAQDAFPEETPPAWSITKTSLSKWRAQQPPLGATAKKVILFAACFALIVALQCTITVISVHNITIQTVLKCVVSLILTVACAPSIHYGILNIIKPLAMQVRYTRKTPGAPICLERIPIGDAKAGAYQEMLRAGFSLVASVGAMVLTAYGFTAHLPIVASASVVTFVANHHYPRMSIQNVIFALFGSIVFCATMVGIGQMRESYSGSEEAGKDTSSDDAASTWPAVNLMFTLLSVALRSMQHPQIAMTLRFEHSQAAGSVERPSNVSSEAPVYVPFDYPKFPCPIFLTSIASLSLSLVAMDIVVAQYGGDAVFVPITPAAAGITLPVVSACTALAAAHQGVLRQWWRYSETWVPQNNDDIEQAP
ncbi:hypothetical protein B9479_003323 [Cryptococcus floricola]|uniref:Uncharacterized protein n=1 Tax=Cryptococcus floricola TaxID=2591691 RepID=A0A5D3AYS3_9TREE|nr:hypothetical protein B9479_003323 [Cryptococcus floricola]